jgi:hypothetical protein
MHQVRGWSRRSTRSHGELRESDLDRARETGVVRLLVTTSHLQTVNT